MKFYVTRTIKTLKGNKQVTYSKGSKISQNVYNKLSNTLKQYVIPAKNAPRADALTQQEAELIVTHYVGGSTVDDMISDFLVQFPKRSNFSGLECQYRILAGCDKTTDDQGLQNPGKALQRAMNDIDYDRFNGVGSANKRTERALIKAAEAILAELRG